MYSKNDINNKYFAFISYSSKDEKTVKWLHRKLENYRIPTSIASDTNPQGEKQLRYLRPIFWYKQDLSGTVLSESLESNLSDSRFLIVVCSPASAASQWVNDEVETFIRQGKESKIIPLIVDGIPNSGNPATECFPQALRTLGRERELRGINLLSQGREHALVDIIATMLGVRFDSLWQRHKRRQRRNLLAGVLVGLIFALGCLGVWDYNRSRTEYFLDYAEGGNGVPQGINKIDKAELKHAHAAFRFTYSRTPLGESGALSWRLDKVEYVNPGGSLYDNKPDAYVLFYPVQEFRYQEGRLAEIINKDFYGRTTLRYSVKDDFNGEPAAIYDITGSDLGQSSGYLTASTALASSSQSTEERQRSKIKRLHIIRDENGRMERITYHANNDDDLESSITADNNGFYGQAFTRDSLGRITSITYLDEYGSPTDDFRGVATTVYTYGKPSTIEYRDKHGNAVYGNLGVGKIVVDVNDYGRPNSVSYFDLDGHPMLSNEYVHKCVLEYDNRGFEISREAFGIDGNKVLVKSGWSKVELDRTGKGLTKRERYYGLEGEPVLSENVFAVREYGYNSAGQLKEIRYYNVDGEPAYNINEGDYGQRMEYDDEGYRTHLYLLGADWSPFNSPSTNYASIGYKYDKYHRCTEMRYFDADGDPVRCNNKHAGVLRSYDTRGNETEIVYIDPQGKPTTTSGGVAITRRKYDTRGNVTGVYFFNPDETPAFVKGRFAEEAEYSRHGQQTVKKYLDRDGRLMIGPEWWAFRVREFDDNGHKISETYYGVDSLPTLDKNVLAAKITYIHDADGNIIEEEYFDRKGDAALMADGYHRIRATYDNRGHVTGRRYYSVDGKSALYKGQYHRDTVTYDSFGNIKTMTLFMADGTPGVSSQKVHRIENDYNVRGLLIETRRFGRDDKLLQPDSKQSYAVLRNEYNELGLGVDKRYYDNNMMPFQYEGTVAERGAFREHAVFAPNGQPREMVFYSARDTVNPAYKIVFEMNPYGQIISHANFDGDGYPIEIHIVARSENRYDNRGRLTSSKDFSAEGKMIRWLVNEYDSLDRVVRISQLNADSALTVNQIRGMETRFAVLEKKYDHHGNETEFDYFDINGKRMDAGNGFSTIRHSYDDRGRKTETEAFAHNGKPATIGTMGWHRQTTKYNDRNLVEQIDYYDHDGHPANTPFGTQYQSRVVMVYDDYGRRTDIVNYRYENGKYVKNENLPAAVQTNSSVATQVLGIVEMPGSFKDAGITGAFYILLFDTWTIHDSLDRFGEVLGSTGNKSRRIVFLPLEQRNGQVEFGTPIDMVFPPGPLGVRLMDTNYEGISEILESSFKNIKASK